MRELKKTLVQQSFLNDISSVFWSMSHLALLPHISMLLKFGENFSYSEIQIQSDIFF